MTAPTTTLDTVRSALSLGVRTVNGCPALTNVLPALSGSGVRTVRFTTPGVGNEPVACSAVAEMNVVASSAAPAYSLDAGRKALPCALIVTGLADAVTEPGDTDVSPGCARVTSSVGPSLTAPASVNRASVLAPVGASPATLS